jgi:hypothetical protein
MHRTDGGCLRQPPFNTGKICYTECGACVGFVTRPTAQGKRRIRSVYMKRMFYAALFFLLLIFMAADIGVTIDYLRRGDISGLLIGGAFASFLGWGIYKSFKKAFGKEEVRPGVQQFAPGAVSPEMDHTDDMAVQYNPYFSDVYAEQAKEQQQQIAQQMQQQQLLQQQMMQQEMLQQQLLRQQAVQQQMAQQTMAQQQMVRRQMEQQAIAQQMAQQQMARQRLAQQQLAQQQMVRQQMLQQQIAQQEVDRQLLQQQIARQNEMQGGQGNTTNRNPIR